MDRCFRGNPTQYKVTRGISLYIPRLHCVSSDFAVTGNLNNPKYECQMASNRLLRQFATTTRCLQNVTDEYLPPPQIDGIINSSFMQSTCGVCPSCLYGTEQIEASMLSMKLRVFYLLQYFQSCSQNLDHWQREKLIIFSAFFWKILVLLL